jgi:hypothetical protein
MGSSWKFQSSISVLFCLTVWACHLLVTYELNIFVIMIFHHSLCVVRQEGAALKFYPSYSIFLFLFWRNSVFLSCFTIGRSMPQSLIVAIEHAISWQQAETTQLTCNAYANDCTVFLLFCGIDNVRTRWTDTYGQNVPALVQTYIYIPCSIIWNNLNNAVLTEDFCGFPGFIQPNAGNSFEINHDYFLLLSYIYIYIYIYLKSRLQRYIIPEESLNNQKFKQLTCMRTFHLVRPTVRII